MYRGLLLSFLFFVGAAQAQQRLQVIGDVSATTKPAESAMLVEGTLLEVARQISPKGWSGFASKSVNPSIKSSARIEKGQVWTDVLARWLEAEGLTARVDASRRLLLIDGPIQAASTTKEPVSNNLPASAPASPTLAMWEVKSSDGTLSRALLRWASQGNAQVLYEAPQDIAAVAVKYSGSFEQSLEALLKDTGNGSYPLHGCQYNNIIRILHISQQCDR